MFLVNFCTQSFFGGGEGFRRLGEGLLEERFSLDLGLRRLESDLDLKWIHF